MIGFVTRGDSLSSTAAYYGENTPQYEFHKKMLSIRDTFEANNMITIRKECKQEDVEFTFRRDENGIFAVKKHYIKGEITPKKQKETWLGRDEFHFIWYTLVDYIIDGYEFIE